MSKTHRLHLVAAIFAAMFVLSSTAPVYTQVAVRLLGQLDPFEGEIRYGDVWGEGNYAYLASFNGTGVMIFDISDPASPKLAGHYNPSEGGRFQDVVVINGIGYFSSENRGGLHIVDVRTPANPVLLSQINEDKRGFANVHEIFVVEGILYEADSRTNRVKVFDVRDQRAPVFVRDIDTNDPRVHAAIVNNGRLFTSGLGGKTDIYDVRRVLTEQPAHLGTVDSGTGSHSTWVSNDGKILAVARETSNGDVRVFDISNPASPMLASTITAQSLGIEAFSPHNPYIIGNLLFVSWYQAGLIIIDITNPSQPRLAGSYDTYSGTTSGFRGCWGVYPFLGFDRVLLGDMDNGLYVVDATAAVAGPRTVSSASYGVSAIAPKSIVAAFGSNLASVTQIATSTPLPTSIAGTSITVQDLTGTERLAPLFFVSANQINYQIPAGTTPGSALLKFTNGGQTTLGSAIIAASAPSIFTMDASGNGAAAALDAFTFAIAPFNATRSGGEPNVIAVFGTGFGADATDVDANVSANVQATIDEQPVTALYAGRAPGFVGLNQTNILFPAGITPGVHRLVITRNGVSSNQVTIAVR